MQFYNKFIWNLSTLTEPLTHLTRKDTPWRWGAEEQSTFQELKDILSTDTVLAHFNPTQQISISCDTSNVGIDAVLFHQNYDGSECLIGNVSKTLTDIPHCYSQIQKEGLAVIFVSPVSLQLKFLFGYRSPAIDCTLWSYKGNARTSSKLTCLMGTYTESVRLHHRVLEDSRPW